MTILTKRDADSWCEAACKTLEELLNNPDIQISDQHETVLDRFSEMAATDPRLHQLGEIARSISALLHGRSGLFLDHRTYIQILAIAPSFIQRINPDYEPFETSQAAPLVTPVTPSEHSESKKVLILTNANAFWILLSTAAQQEGFVCQRISRLDRLALPDSPAAIIIDFDLMSDQESTPDGLSTLRRSYKNPPHLFILGEVGNFDARLFAVRMGATRFFAKPLDARRIISVLKGVTAKEPSLPFRVMLVDDDKSMAPIYENALSKAGFSSRLIANPLSAISVIKDFEPDVIVTDVLMSGCNGLELLSMIRQDDALLETPVIFMTSINDPKRQIEALVLGADDYLVKPVSLPLLTATVMAYAQKSRRLRRTRSDLHGVFVRLKKGECATCGKGPVRELIWP